VRYFVVLLLLLAGCSTETARTLTFPDGCQINTITAEDRTSLFNAALITAWENPQTKQMTVVVQGGTSVGAAVVTAAQAIPKPMATLKPKETKPCLSN
jgi:hypothetical protein